MDPCQGNAEVDGCHQGNEATRCTRLTRHKPRTVHEKGLCWIGGDEMVISDLIPKGAQGFTTSC